MACNSDLNLVDPPDIEASGSYVVIVNPDGTTVMLDKPTNASVLVCDVDSAYWADGTVQFPINLPEQEETAAAFRSIAIFDADGRMYSLVNETATRKVLKCTSGVWSLEEDSNDLPVGSGLLYKAADESVNLFDTLGMFYLAASGIPTAVAGTQANGKIIKIVSDIPTWSDESSGVVSSGAGTTGLDTVAAKYISSNTIDVDIPQFTLTDGTSELTVNNVNVTVNISSAVGLLGKETGMTETASTWYYIYIISDGVLVSAVISPDPVSPDLTDIAFAGYTYYGLCTVFRENSSSNIVGFVQKGRRFWIDWDFGLMCIGANVTTSMAAVPEAVGAGSLALAAIIPPEVKTIDGYAIGTTGVNQYLISGWDGTLVGTFGIGSQQMRDSGAVAGSGNFYNLPIIDPTSPQIAHRAVSNKSDRSVRIIGYTI